MSDCEDNLPELFIPVTSKRLLAGFDTHIESCHLQNWKKFCYQISVIVDTVYQLKYNDFKEEIEIQTQKSPSLFQTVAKLAGKAHYFPLPQKIYHAALSGWYSFPLSTVINWNSIDDEEASCCRNQLYSTDTPIFANKVLIFTRGISVSSRSGNFLQEKLDEFADKLFSRFLRWWKESGRVEPQTTVEPCESIVLANRRTLKNHLDYHGFLGGMLKPVTITEPTFSNVLMLYRRKKQTNEEKVGNIVLRRFEDIPFADIDALFPVRHIHLRPFDRLQFYFQVMLCCWFVWLSGKAIFADDIPGDGMMLLCFGVLTAVILRIYGLVYCYTLFQQSYLGAMNIWQESKCKGTGKVVTSQLMEEVKEQELKEILLSYFILWKFGPMTKDELELRTVEFLKKEFGVAAVFDVEDGLGKAMSLKLVVDDRLDANGVCVYRTSTTPDSFVAAHSGLDFLADVVLS